MFTAGAFAALFRVWTRNKYGRRQGIVLELAALSSGNNFELQNKISLHRRSFLQNSRRSPPLPPGSCNIDRQKEWTLRVTKLAKYVIGLKSAFCLLGLRRGSQNSPNVSLHNVNQFQTIIAYTIRTAADHFSQSRFQTSIVYDIYIYSFQKL